MSEPESKPKPPEGNGTCGAHRGRSACQAYAAHHGKPGGWETCLCTHTRAVHGIAE